MFGPLVGIGIGVDVGSGMGGDDVIIEPDGALGRRKDRRDRDHAEAIAEAHAKLLDDERLHASSDDDEARAERARAGAAADGRQELGLDFSG